MILVSKEVKDLAVRTLEQDRVMRITDRFTVYEVPTGNMDHYSLVVFAAGSQLSDAEQKSLHSLVLPMTLADGRSAYFIEPSAAERLT